MTVAGRDRLRSFVGRVVIGMGVALVVPIAVAGPATAVGRVATDRVPGSWSVYMSTTDGTVGENVILEVHDDQVDPGIGPPTGPVRFTLNGTVISSVQLAGGDAAVDHLVVGPGTYNVMYFYGGDNNYQPSTGTIGTLTISKDTPALRVSSSANPSALGAPITFTARVIPTTAPQATGSVQFTLDGNSLGAPVPLSGDSASITRSDIRLGVHDVAASYAGDNNLNPAVEIIALTLTVVPAPPTNNGGGGNPGAGGGGVPASSSSGSGSASRSGLSSLSATIAAQSAPLGSGPSHKTTWIVLTGLLAAAALAVIGWYDHRRRRRAGHE